MDDIAFTAAINSHHRQHPVKKHCKWNDNNHNKNNWDRKLHFTDSMKLKSK